MEREKQGFIYTWSLLKNGFVVTSSKEVFFLHFSAITQGADLAEIGQPVEFDVAPPRPGKRYPRAVNVIVGPSESTNGGRQ